MNENPLTETGGVYTYDFTTGSSQIYGGALGSKEVAPGIWGMIGGDGDCNGQVSSPDKVDVWSVETGNAGYLNGDFDLNGNVNNQDKVDLWSENAGTGTIVPDYIPQGGFGCKVPE